MSRPRISSRTWQSFVAHLTEHGVVKLEEAELHAVAAGVDFLGRGLANGSHLRVVRLKLFQYGFGAAHDALRHSGDLRHVDTEGVFGAASFELSQEDYLAVHLAHADMITLPSTSRTLTL